MNPLLRKEIRLIMPAWIVAMFLAAIPLWTTLLDGGLFYGALALGLILPSLGSFGMEFNSSTFSALLAQPIERGRIWRIKVSVLSIALLTFVMAFLWCMAQRPLSTGVSFPELVVLSFLSAAAALSGGLWTTLLFRQTATAFGFAILIPAALVTMTEVPLVDQPHTVRNPIDASVLILYSIIGFFFARRLFLRAQDAQWTGGTISIPTWLAFGLKNQAHDRAVRYRPLRALVVKEFSLHHASFFIAGILLLSHVLAIGVRKAIFDPLNPNRMISMILGYWWIVWFCVPAMIGSTVVAEERRQGTLEAQLCLPVRRWKQFAIKFLLAMLLAIALGFAPAFLLERFASARPSDIVGGNAADWSKVFVALISLDLLFAFFTFYASTLTRSLLQATLLAVVIGVACVGGSLAIGARTFQGESSRHGLALWSDPLIICTVIPTMFAASIALSFRNFRHVQTSRRLWLGNLLGLLVPLLAVCSADALAYNRVWELWMNLEPIHGPARMDGAVRPRLEAAGANIFALLPDGRLWVAREYRIMNTDRYIMVSRGGVYRPEMETAAVPVTGTFIGGSDWISVNRMGSEILGIKADGTLWSISIETKERGRAIWTGRTNSISISDPRQIGTDADWKSIAADSGYWLGVKKDGTLWGWGKNWYSLLGPGPNDVPFNGEPVRIGTDSNWFSVFTRPGNAVAVKQDGSVWRWGNSSGKPGVGDDKHWTPEFHPDEIRWNLEGKEFVNYIEFGGINLALKKDGSIWAFGRMPPNLLGRPVGAPWSSIGSPVRVGDRTNWAALSPYPALAAVTKDGRLFENNPYVAPGNWRGGFWQPSKRSDWIAVSRSDYFGSPVFALSADGTISAWLNPNRHNPLAILGPSRKPLWSFNIFSESK